MSQQKRLLHGGTLCSELILSFALLCQLFLHSIMFCYLLLSNISSRLRLSIFVTSPFQVCSKNLGILSGSHAITEEEKAVELLEVGSRTHIARPEDVCIPV